MKILQIDPVKAKVLYKTASSEFKIMLEDTFGKDYFKEISYTDITSVEKACEYLGTYLVLPEGLNKREIATRKLEVIIKAINKITNFKANIYDSNQRKWYPYFSTNCGFSFYVTTYINTFTYVSSALYVKESEIAKFLGEKFTNLYKEMYE